MRISPTAIVILVGSVAAIPPNIMPVLSAELVREYSLSDAQLGYFVAAGTLAGAIASLSAPYWVSRVRIRWVILGSLVMYACAIHVLPVAPSVPLLYALQFLLGGSLVIVSSICSSVLLRRPNPARTMSLKISSDVIIASAFLYLLPVSILGLSGLVAAVSLCFAVGVWLASFWPKDHDRIAPRPVSADQISHAPMGAWWVLATLVVFYTAGVSGWNYLGRLALHAGLDVQQSSSAIAVGLLLGIIGSLGAASLAGRFRTIWPETVSGVVFAGSVVALGSVKGFVPFLVAALLFNIAWNFFIPYLMGLLAWHDRSGRLATLLPATAMLGGVVGPPITGNLMQYAGYDLAMSVMGGLAATSIAGYFVLALKKARTHTVTL